MYIIYRKDYYKPIICEGILGCIMFGVLPYHYIARGEGEESSAFSVIIVTIFFIIFTLYYLIKYLRKDKDFVVLRIDDNGILLCQKKNEEVFIEWEKIKHVIFLHYNGGSKVIVRQHNKETHELFFTINYKSEFVMSRGAIKAAYKYTDDRDKIMEVGSFLYTVYDWDTTYGDIMYDLYEKERKKRDRERKKRDRERKREREKRLKEKREKREREKRLKEERKKGEREKY